LSRASQQRACTVAGHQPPGGGHIHPFVHPPSWQQTYDGRHGQSLDTGSEGLQHGEERGRRPAWPQNQNDHPALCRKQGHPLSV
ncbi:BLOC-1-related complex subunit 6, partial [Clarias magur]